MSVRLAPVRVVSERRGDALHLRSGHPLADPPPHLGSMLWRAVALAPNRVFLAEAAGEGAYREVTYQQALAAAEGIGQSLAASLDEEEARLLVLSGNSIDHALITLAGYLTGVTVVPISVAYSTLSRDLSKLRHVARKVRPRWVFAAEREPFARALALEELAGAEVITGDDLPGRITRAPGLAFERRRDAVGPDTVAKILFTSGSTGMPKGVLNTHRMLCANQQMIAQLWPFVAEEPPVLVDWLPWSHTFGGNHNLHLVLHHQGTLVIDEGKPRPGLLEPTLRHLQARPPTIDFNVPAGYAALLPHLEDDDALRTAFFSRLRLMFYAGAALPDETWQRLVAVAKRAGRDDVFMTTAWGSTETSPLSTSAHFPLERAGNVGVPAPGVELKLVEAQGKQEVRVKGPHVTPGYLGEPGLTEAAFDEEGFYLIGDAMRLADPVDPSAGLVFDGRVAEDFKLATGTWVSVGTLRTGLLSACEGQLSDAVIAGHDRDVVAALAWPAAGAEPDAIRAGVARWNEAHPGSSTRVVRLLLLDEPPSIDAGEITDKGYVNQRATRERRAADVERLFAADPDPAIMELS